MQFGSFRKGKRIGSSSWGARGGGGRILTFPKGKLEKKKGSCYDQSCEK